MNMNFKSNFFLMMIGLVAILNACKKADNSDVPSLNEYAYKGTFQSGTHPTSGLAKITINKASLVFENFKSDNGPDLNIYLASDLKNIKADHIDLGDIKGLKGNYTYAVNPAVDLTKYKYVVVWCVDFDVNFGYALLAP
ncbi:DM13 domain-containing protein [Daejeonella sp.]|uniref:DM13 domain-containing protein n=1 Tax=Daejeonella sp. TaxID=2805397 RepID=UPI0025B7D404|nr:DM13 domain-containing protein [Daejeonella sp.]